MIFILNILINLLLILSVFLLTKRRRINREVVEIHKEDKALRGKLDKMYIKVALAEKIADRAFNMASSANLGVMALQKSLATPKYISKVQSERNGLAKKEVDALFSDKGNFDWLRPILSDEELDILDNAERAEQKAKLKGN
jgi:hypothetical protein